jgi:hypothetical protein
MEEKVKVSKRKAARVPPNRYEPQRSYSHDTITTNLEQPRSIDIICGRRCGRSFTKSKLGNAAFRKLIEHSAWKYEAANNLQKKRKVNREMLELVKAQPGAPRFLTENPTTKVWEELSFKRSLRKTSQTFRYYFGKKPMSKATSSDDESEVDDDDNASVVVQDLRSKTISKATSSDSDDESFVVEDFRSKTMSKATSHHDSKADDESGVEHESRVGDNG